MIEDIAFFAGLDQAQRAVLLQDAVTRHYRKGAIILGRDDASDYLFVIVSGSVEAYIEEGGKRIIVNTIGAGETFGELAMLSGEPRSANIVATEDCEVLVMQKQDVYRLIDTEPAFARNLIRLLAKKVNTLTDDVSSLALLDVYSRIARLLQQHDGERLTQQDIADRVGSSREMVSRILKDLRAGDYISIDKRQISIRKPLPESW